MLNEQDIAKCVFQLNIKAFLDKEISKTTLKRLKHYDKI